LEKRIVFNAGGGRDNSISILEAIDKINKLAKTNWNNYTFVEEPRKGDHKWYITDYSKFLQCYPNGRLSMIRYYYYKND